MSPDELQAMALLALVAFTCEYFDASLGMGYGTTLTPILLLMGYAPLEAVPSVLLSEVVAGVAAGGWHHRLRNVSFRRGSPELAVVGILVVFGAIGGLVAVFAAVELAPTVVRAYIGGMVVMTGLTILLLRGRMPPLRRGRLVAVALVAAFNKGIGGGGYGPVVTGGQLLSGQEPRKSVAVTALAEALVSLVAVVAYVALRERVDWAIVLPLMAGAVLSTPLSALTVRRLPQRALRPIIAAAMIVLGGLTLAGLAVGPS